MNIHEQVKHGMALAFFASAYADQADDCGQPMRGEIMDQLPDDIDPAALHAADTLAMDLVRANWRSAANALCSQIDTGRGLGLLYTHANEHSDGGGDRELTPELFGHYLAMQAMGTGVGLESFGDQVRDAITVPYVEFGSYSLEKDYFEPLEA